HAICPRGQPSRGESWRSSVTETDRVLDPDLSRGQTGSWRGVAKVYAQGALYEAGGVNHEIHRELVVDSSSRVVATRRSLLLLIRRSDYWIAHVVRTLIRIFKNTCEPVRHLGARRPRCRRRPAASGSVRG